MKKLIFIIALIAIALSSSGQKMSVGPKAGVNFSTLTNSPGVEMISGLNAGGFFVYSIVEHFGVSVDLHYSNEGAKYTTEIVDNSGLIRNEYKLCLHYLRAPILANVFFGSLGDRLRPKISFGPSLGFLLGVKNNTTTTITEGGMVTTSESENTNSSGYSNFDFSGLVGAGLNYEIKDNAWLNLDVRYCIGATGIYDVNPNSMDIKSNTFSVSLGLAFAISSE